MKYFTYWKLPNGSISKDRVVQLDREHHCPEEAAQDTWEYLRKKFPKFAESVDIYVSTYPIARSGRPVTVYTFVGDEMTLKGQETDGCDCCNLTSLNMHWILLTNHHENCDRVDNSIRTDEAAMKILGLLRIIYAAKATVPATERDILRTCLTIAGRVMTKEEYGAMDNFINKMS